MTPTLSAYDAENVWYANSVPVVGLTDPTVGAVVSDDDEDDAETVTVVDEPVPLFPAASVHTAYAVIDPAGPVMYPYVAVPLVVELPSAMVPAGIPLTYNIQLDTPTASEYVAENVVMVVAVAVVGVIAPTTGAVVSAVARLNAGEKTRKPNPKHNANPNF